MKAKPISWNDNEITFRSTDTPKDLHQRLLMNNVDTMEKLFRYAVKWHSTKKCLGTREVLGEKEEIQKDGRVLKKYNLGDYIWTNFIDTEKQMIHFGRGLRELGMKPKDRVAIFSETRAEWMIAAHGLFKHRCAIVTIYATLGEEAIAHGINEAEVDTVITSHELLPKIRKILKMIPHIKKIIYFNDKLHKTDTSNLGTLNIHQFNDVIELGSKSTIQESLPVEDDIAIIMYTSGSTGVPKGVQLSHKNVLLTTMSCSDNFNVQPDDVYIAFLPLAHVLEFVGESVVQLMGVPIGFSSAMTLLDISPKVMTGCKGDASVIKPTVSPMVPLILDRIVKGINDKVNHGSTFLKAVFRFAFNYKKKWVRRGFKTPLLDTLIFKKLAKLVGGRMRLVVCGGAPLSVETHEIVKLGMCINVLQGYGLTETAGAATVMDQEELEYGHVGGPLPCSEIRLVNWEEGNYRVTNKPNPKGEILIGGNNIAMGYLNLPEKTAESFFEEDGKRWFRTGDIGEMNPRGVLKIIDRKKDLVKLQQGEYLSLGKVESQLKTCPLVDNICIHADPTKTRSVALIMPAENFLKEFAKKAGFVGSYDSYFSNSELKNLVFDEIMNCAKSSRLEKFEIPMAITLCNDVWSADNGLVTAAFKIKRKEIYEKYKNEIKKMYES